VRVLRILLNTLLLTVLAMLIATPTFLVLSLKDAVSPNVLGVNTQQLVQKIPEENPFVWIRPLSNAATHSSDLITYSYETRDRKTVSLFSLENISPKLLTVSIARSKGLFGESVPHRLYLLICSSFDQCDSYALNNSGSPIDAPFEFSLAPQETKKARLLIESYGEGASVIHNASFELSLAFRAH